MIIKKISSIFGLIAIVSAPLQINALTINKTVGWHGTAAVEWADVAGAALYSVTYSGEGVDNCPVDDELIRQYPDYWRVDIPGLKAGDYTITVNAYDISNKLIETSTTLPIEVVPYVREGFAFSNGVVPGAYNLNGTPKDGARILYITPENVNTVTFPVIIDGKGKEAEGVGLSAILKNFNKGYDKRPLIIRMIGCVRNVDGLKGGTAVELTGANFSARATENVTFEGVGNDATAYGFGFYTKRCKGIEIRNLAVMLFPNDGIAVEYDNRNLWFHNCDFFYGMPGKDSDQKKGDGTIDMKYNSSDITVDHNHFWDSGKCTFAGGEKESDAIYFTYHHNWFDHVDSRCPRLCHASTHIYNNYFDANATMSLLSTENTSAFVEANYYRNCPSPMEINMQGTNRQRWPNGTQNGGMNKGFTNLYEGDYTLITQLDDSSDFDVYVVSDRAEKIPSTVKSLKGENIYDNFDTAPGMYLYTPDAPADVPEIVKNRAGRMEGGDFKWDFNDSVDDKSTEINQPLKDKLLAYNGQLLSIGGKVSVVSGIDNVESMSNNSEIEIYNLQGKKVATGAPYNLPIGIYIVKSSLNVKKIIVK